MVFADGGNDTEFTFIFDADAGGWVAGGDGCCERTNELPDGW